MTAVDFGPRGETSKTKLSYLELVSIHGEDTLAAAGQLLTTRPELIEGLSDDNYDDLLRAIDFVELCGWEFTNEI